MTQIARINLIADYQAAFASSMRALNLENANRLITALSGGPDSTALACLADLYARTHGKEHQAVIVNHNIRPEATAEAVRVSQRMKKRAITSHIVTIKDKAPETGLQEWARHQRFAVLAKMARKKGAVLLFGHQRADQAETVLMRLSRGSGIVGLAGIVGVSMRDAVLVARPLLDWDAKTLVSVLGLVGCDYEDDPSNQNSQFERVQMRKFLGYAEASGLPLIDDALRLGRVMRALSDHLDQASSTLWQAATHMFPTGHAVIDIDKLSNLPYTAWVYRIRQLIRQVGGRPYFVSDKAVAGLHERLLAGLNSTLGGCQFVKSTRPGRTACFYLVRELGRTPEVLDVAVDDDVIFAGCWRVWAKQAGRLLHAGALAKSEERAASKAWPADIATLPYIVRRAIPVITTLDGGVVYPQLIERHKQLKFPRKMSSAQFLGL